MKNPVAFWLDYSKESQTDFAKNVGLSQGYMSSLVTGRSPISAKALQKLCDYLNLTPEEFYNCESDRHIYKSVPLMASRPWAGPGGEEQNNGVVDWLHFKSKWLNSKGNVSDMKLFRIRGLSMSPTLEEGDLILIDSSRKEIVTGHMFLIRINDELMVKRLESVPGKILFHSDNPEYKTIELSTADESQEVEIYGRVIWFCREF